MTAGPCYANSEAGRVVKNGLREVAMNSVIFRLKSGTEFLFMQYNSQIFPNVCKRPLLSLLIA